MIYIVGGNDGNSILDIFEVYDFVLKQIKSLPKLLEKRDELSLTLCEGFIYAIGGFGGDSDNCLSSVERYSLSLN